MIEWTKIRIQSLIAFLWIIFVVCSLGFLTVGLVFFLLEIAIFAAVAGELGIVTVVIIEWVYRSNNGTEIQQTLAKINERLTELESD